MQKIRKISKKMSKNVPSMLFEVGEMLKTGNIGGNEANGKRNYIEEF